MSEKERQEYRKNGFIIFEKWQFIVLIMTIVFSVGVFVATTQAALSAHEKKIESIEVWEKVHETEQNISVAYNNRKIDEMSFNLKVLCEKFGVKYTSSEINK